MMLSVPFHLNAEPYETTEKQVVLYSLSDCCAGVGWPEAEATFLKELDSLGITVERYPGSVGEDGVGTELLEPFVDNKANVAAILFYKRESAGRVGVYVVVFEHADGASDMDFFSFEISDGKGADTVATLKAVEAVHAAFFERPLEKKSAPEAEPEPGPSSESSEKAEDDNDDNRRTESADEDEADEGDDHRDRGDAKPGRWAISAVPEVLYSPGGVGPMFAIDGSVQVMLWQRLVLEVAGMVSLYGRKLEVLDNSVTFRVFMFRGAVLWNILQHGRFHPLVGLNAGGGAAMSGAAGRANAETRDVIGWIGHIGGDARLSIDLASMLALRLGVRVEMLLPKVEVGAWVAEENNLERYVSDIEFGRPLIEGYLGLDIRF